MRAIVVHRFGGPEVLELAEVPTPEPGPGEVRIRVEACAVCFHDVSARAGAFRHTPLPLVLGHEVAGVVDAVGPGVADLAPGTPVVAATGAACGTCAYCRSGEGHLCLDGPGMFGEVLPGGYAEYMAGPAAAFAVRPPGLGAAAAACLPCAAATALHALRRAAVRPGETVLVTGASGGVGVHAIQLARAMGAQVLAVTTSAAKAARLADLGADQVLVSPDLDFAAQARQAAGGRGPAVALDMVGGRAFASCIRALARGGRLILVGHVESDPVPFQPGLVVLKALTLAGVYAGGMADLQGALAAASAGQVRPLVAAELPLAAAATAHRLLADRAAFGRVVLRP